MHREYNALALALFAQLALALDYEGLLHARPSLARDPQGLALILLQHCEDAEAKSLGISIVRGSLSRHRSPIDGTQQIQLNALYSDQQSCYDRLGG